MTRDLMPRLSPPVKRPDIVQPWTIVDLAHGSGREIVNKLQALTHGANLNDPGHIADNGFLRSRGSR